ncbi:hypothetical protein E2986_09443 [Frieseomelitta varia]|uniref:Uncharacterized protein n=1 Tax=Frieseomelitta varia TaxID=561572 RepID=A0A833VJ01_9HYME|nr:hypothetical protein E2986_09443 [Frieseomelitta varia]
MECNEVKLYNTKIGKIELLLHHIMEFFSQNDYTSSIASSGRYREEIISSEEQLLLQFLQKGMLETSEENIAFGKKILSLLNKLNLEPQSLPSDIKEGLQKVALLLKCEKLYDFDIVTLNIVNERKKIEETKRQHEEKQLALLYNDLSRKYTNFSKKLDCLQEALNSLENFIENSQKEQTDIHCNHISLFTKLSELAELNQYLSQYKDLPPNLLQAKALLEVKKKEYESLENTFLEKTK